VAATLGVAAILVLLTPVGGAAQTYRAPRTPDGQPDFSGIWQALNSAAWNVEDHTGSLGMPPGQGVVEGGTIPYLPEALKKRDENFANRNALDPEAQCFLLGVPRSMYHPFPFQIMQAPQHFMIAHEYQHQGRTVYLDPKAAMMVEGIDSWMGHSRGRWEGETLVIETTHHNDRTWFDKAGNHHSDALKTTERLTRTGPDHLLYEVTIEDPKTFSRPWKMSMPLYRRQEKNLRLLEYECVQYLQEDKWKSGPVD
jgi:hypothetical protein